MAPFKIGASHVVDILVVCSSVLGNLISIGNMEKYTQQERVEIVKLFYRNELSVTATLRALRAKWPRNHVPNESTVRRLIKKFDETGSVSDVLRAGPSTTVRTSPNQG